MALIAAYGNVSALSPIVFTTANSGTTSSCSLTGGTAPYANSLFIGFCTSFSTPNATGGFSTRTSVWSSLLEDKVLIPAGATGNFTMTGASTSWGTFTLLLSGP